MNNLTGLNVSGLSYLSYLDCSDNYISGIDFTNCYNITGLYLQNNDLSGILNLYKFENLVEVDISSNEFTGVIASGLTDLVYLNASGNNISGIELSGSINITGLNLKDNDLTGSLDLTQFEDLQQVDVSDNNLTGIKITGLSKLETFAANNNSLVSLDFGGSTGIKELYLQNNYITGFDNYNNLTGFTKINITGNVFLDSNFILWITGQYGLIPVASGMFLIQ